MATDFASFDVVMDIRVDYAANQPQCYTSDSRNIYMGKPEIPFAKLNGLKNMIK